MKDDEKLKYALEELNRWHRHFDNFFWTVSSILLTGTVYIFIKILGNISFFLNQKISTTLFILIISVIMIIIWYWYLSFIKDTIIKAQVLFNRINLYENYLGIDILPDMDHTLKKVPMKYMKRLSFHNFLKRITFLVLFLWIIIFFINLCFIIEQLSYLQKI